MNESESEVAQSCLTLSDPMDSSFPGSSVHGLFQARGLEWAAMLPVAVPLKYFISFPVLKNIEEPEEFLFVRIISINICHFRN